MVGGKCSLVVAGHDTSFPYHGHFFALHADAPLRLVGVLARRTWWRNAGHHIKNEAVVPQQTPPPKLLTLLEAQRLNSGLIYLRINTNNDHDVDIKNEVVIF